MKDWLLGEKLESGRSGKILLGVIQSGGAIRHWLSMDRSGFIWEMVRIARPEGEAPGDPGGSGLMEPSLS